MNLKSKLNIHKIWLGFFGIWLILLSGLLDFWLQSPGLKQWYRVASILRSERQEIAAIEEKSEFLHHVAHELEVNPVAQEREVRKVLGYLGEEEVVFEFNP